VLEIKRSGNGIVGNPFEVNVIDNPSRMSLGFVRTPVFPTMEEKISVSNSPTMSTPSPIISSNEVVKMRDKNKLLQMQLLELQSENMRLTEENEESRNQLTCLKCKLKKKRKLWFCHALILRCATIVWQEKENVLCVNKIFVDF